MNSDKKKDVMPIVIGVAVLIALLLLLYTSVVQWKETKTPKTVANTRFTAYNLDNAVSVASSDRIVDGYILVDNETGVEYFCSTSVGMDGMKISSMSPLYNSDGSICTATNSPDNKSREV